MRVRVNAAMSLDGKLATRRRRQLRLSGPEDGERVDMLRGEFDAILVGAGTVKADDPSLTTTIGENPTRVVLDSDLSTAPTATVYDDQAPTIVLTTDDIDSRRKEEYPTGVSIEPAGTNRVSLKRGIDILEAAGVDSLFVEGGGEVIFSALNASIVDELSVYIAPIVIGGRTAPTLSDGFGFLDAFPSFRIERTTTLDDGILLECRLKSP